MKLQIEAIIDWIMEECDKPGFEEELQKARDTATEDQLAMLNMSLTIARWRKSNPMAPRIPFPNTVDVPSEDIPWGDGYGSGDEE